MTALNGAEISEHVLGGFALVVGICLAFYALVAVVLEFIPDASCGCLTGCGTCEAGLTRVRRNRRWGKSALATFGVLMAYALLASTCVRP